MNQEVIQLTEDVQNVTIGIQISLISLMPLNSLIIFESEAVSSFGPNLSSNPCKVAKTDEMETFSSYIAEECGGNGKWFKDIYNVFCKFPLLCPKL